MWRALLCVLVLGVCVRADEPQAELAKKPQWQRMLKGEDVKRAAELKEKITAAEASGMIDDAVGLAGQALQLRKRVQGDDHWEVKNAEVLVAELKLPLTAEQRKQLNDAWQLYEEAGGLKDKARYAAAEELIKKAFVIRKQVLGETHPYTATCQNDLAVLYYVTGRYVEAEPLLMESLRSRRAVLGADHPATATSQHNLAAVYSKTGRHAEAEQLYNGTLRIRKAAFGPDHPDIANCLSSLARLYGSTGRQTEAEPLYQEALRVYRTALGAAHPDTAECMSKLAILYNATGRYADAEPLYKDALRIRQAALGADHPDTANCLNNLASFYSDTGRHVEAEPLLDEALRVHRAALGVMHPYTATSLNNLAVVYRATGRYADAERLYHEALRVRRAAFGGTHSDTANSLYNLALLYYTTGRHVEVEPLLDEALRVYRAALGAMHPDTINCLNGLATLYSATGRHDEAEPLFKDALRVRRAALGAAHPDTANSLNNLALLYYSTGRHTEAEPLLKDALRIRRASLGSTHPYTASSLKNLGLLYVATSRHDDAEPLLAEALRVNQAAFGAAHPDTTLSLNNLGLLYSTTDRPSDAEPLLRDAVHSYELGRIVRASSLKRGISEPGDNPYPYFAVHTARIRPGVAFMAAEADAGRGLLDELVDRGRDGLTPSEQAKRTEVMNRMTAMNARLLILVAQTKLTDAERAERDKLAAERRRLTDTMSNLAAVLSRRQVAELSAIQRALSPDAALVVWVDADTIDGRLAEHWACVVRPTGDPLWEKLPGTGEGGKWSKDDDALPGRLRAALAGSAPASEVAAIARRLQTQRLAPLTKHLAGVKTLHVVPVYAMAGVPVEALTADHQISYIPSGTFLARRVDRPALAGNRLLAIADPKYPPLPNRSAMSALPPDGLFVSQVLPGGAATQGGLKAGDVLLRYAGQELPSIDRLKEVIASNDKAKTNPVVVWREGEARPFTLDVPPGKLGVVLDLDPAPHAVAARRKSDAMLAVGARGGDWQELPGTAAELKGLQALFPDATTLTRSAASPKRLAELHEAKKLAGYRYLHFAAHGEGNSVRAFESALILSGDDKSVGRLTARHVLDNWQLDAELVTLSACETAVGKAAGGDGPLGFAQAFLTAGARAVCLSLWKVDDAATCLLMDRFYRNLLGKREDNAKPMGKAAALSEAKKWLRELSAEQAAERLAGISKGVARGAGEKPLPPLTTPDPAADAKPGDTPFAHPKYWAAFILIGDPD